MSTLHFAKAQLITDFHIILRYCTGINKIVCTHVGEVLKMVNILMTLVTMIVLGCLAGGHEVCRPCLK